MRTAWPRMRKQAVSLKALRCYTDNFLCCGAPVRCKYPTFPCDYHRIPRRGFGTTRPRLRPDGAGTAPEPDNKEDNGRVTSKSSSTWGSGGWGAGPKVKREPRLTEEERKLRESLVATQKAEDEPKQKNVVRRLNPRATDQNNFAGPTSKPTTSHQRGLNERDQSRTGYPRSQSQRPVGNGPSSNGPAVSSTTPKYPLHEKSGDMARSSVPNTPPHSRPRFSQNQDDATPTNARKAANSKREAIRRLNPATPLGWGVSQSRSNPPSQGSTSSRSPDIQKEPNQQTTDQPETSGTSDGRSRPRTQSRWAVPRSHSSSDASGPTAPQFRWISPNMPAQEFSQRKPVDSQQPPSRQPPSQQKTYDQSTIPERGQPKNPGNDQSKTPETSESPKEPRVPFSPEAYSQPHFPNFRRVVEDPRSQLANDTRGAPAAKSGVAEADEFDELDDMFAEKGAKDPGQQPHDKQTPKVDPVDKNFRKQAKHKTKLASDYNKDKDGGKDDFDDFDGDLGPRDGKRKRNRKADKSQNDAADSGPTPIYLPEFIAVSNLADALSQRKPQFLRRIQDLGFEEATYDHVLDAETAGLIAAEFNYEAIADTTTVDDLVAAPAPEDASVLSPRPPVVTIMGHVDHGKTTILDWLRKSSVAAAEHGGITQHIGAFSVKMPTGKLITFLDTPGHAAFLDMRRRGADVTDIVILVVAADDSVKPQTLEAIKHANESNVPIIVAISKVDKPEINVENVKRDLARHNVNVEDFGGDVQTVGVSGKTGQGMQELEEATVTLSEMLELRAQPSGSAEGWIIEAATEKGGRVATVLVRRGTLKLGNVVVAGKTWARIRNLRNEAGVHVQEAAPGTPVAIDGWKDLPTAGDEVLQAVDEQRAKEVVELRLEKEETQKMGGDMQAINETRRIVREKRQQALTAEEQGILNEAAATSDQTDSKITIPLIVKADVSGSVEAVVNFISSIGTGEIYPSILRAAAGKVTEFDIKHAAVAKGMILTFNEPTDSEISKLARAEGVDIVDHTIIYELIDDVKARLSEKLAPRITHRVLGEAEIAEVFEITLKRREKTAIAGCRITNGVVGRSHKVKVFRANEMIYDGTLSSLKNVKKDVTEMRKGTECGVGFDSWTDFKVGDQIQTYEEIHEKRSL